MTDQLPPRPANPPQAAEPRSLLEEPESPSHARISYTENDIIVGRVTLWFARHPWVRKAAGGVAVLVFSAMATYGTCTVHDNAQGDENIQKQIAALGDAQKQALEKVLVEVQDLARDVRRLDKEASGYAGDIRVLQEQHKSQDARIEALDKQISAILRQRWITDQ